MRSAVAGIDGIPSASSGIMAVPVTALLAVSGPATPAIAPLPNCSGCFESRFSTAYDTKVETTWLTPGMIPENEADDRCPPDRRRRFPQVGPARDQLLEFRPDRFDRRDIFQVDQDFRNAEQADRERGKG